MKLSILDQSPVLEGKSANEALQESLRLATFAEENGFHRFWIAEHHGFDQLASSVPEVMLAYLGSHTHSIRLGAGAILLPHYRPYKVAETFNMLATLFPNRIDLGIGRAPGGSAEASIALSGNFLENVRKTPASIVELFHFLYHDFPPDHAYANVEALPFPLDPPEPWILGTSMKSAQSAAKHGTGYAFAHFMSDNNGKEIIRTYKDSFKVNKSIKRPYVIVAVHVICAETMEEAEAVRKLANSRMESDSGKAEDQQMKVVIGDQKTVKHRLKQIKQAYYADEIMIITMTDKYESRLKSYELIAKAFM
ncbi:LLM class flavin-dependent oxidoreductase [Aquibacillus koreensis]|uniref:LLM class flavin-dependent oxidoreductase n=1 Tax=Aquibacillus koreensis TaxID=279446 RepID=A0A9X4AIM3_9BACI|nr:LLM class flavin-dependent oxidoreductase [Aquibacillus koreensis]MCT2536352.1 LLM class flavin-dependent oxidoreductase [Aquibacillus koreensis]MDC3421297.1 LLM class flavin-dependent oxidoreductase [Aquibacillus koreensis]